MKKTMQFHPGELYFQHKTGVEQQAAKLASVLITRYMSLQHQEFYSRLNMVFIASVGLDGKPWASVISGPTGFIQIIDDTHFKINSNILANDPLRKNLEVGRCFGFLGLQFETRRRNRISAILIKRQLNTLYFKVDIAFGNCPKYIQTRKINKFEITDIKVSQVREIQQLDTITKRIILNADTFFIASYYEKKDHQGCDVSHRGGKPGFVNIINNKEISFDDFSGNDLFMTLGNLKSNPVTGLLFIDFKSGELLQLSCRSEILEFPHKKHQRQVRLFLDKGYYYKLGVLIESEFLEYSPYLL